MQPPWCFATLSAVSQSIGGLYQLPAGATYWGSETVEISASATDVKAVTVVGKLIAESLSAIKSDAQDRIEIDVKWPLDRRYGGYGYEGAVIQSRGHYSSKAGKSGGYSYAGFNVGYAAYLDSKTVTKESSPRHVPRSTAFPKAIPQVYPHDSTQPFRLAMHWENGYFWQESYLEKRYCAQCMRSCSDGDYLWTRNCNSRSRRQYFVMVDNTLRPNNNQQVCVTRNEDMTIRLYKCVLGSTQQEWNGIDFGSKFELTAGKFNDKMCLSQYHEPKESEVLYMETCELARLYDTSYWITRYDDDGEEGDEDYIDDEDSEEDHFNEDGAEDYYDADGKVAQQYRYS
jgi:hypothetical protein